MDQLTAHDPRRIGPFEVLGRLGAGGMGLVYLGRSSSGRRVAIKTVRGELAEDQLFRVRFAREIAAARTVSGFYTAAVVDADADAPVPWLATAYIPAPSLEDLVAECGPMPVGASRWLIAGIAEALQSIHAAGLVHRDLKPSNVLVTEDGPRVIDFGIAAGVSHTRLTMTNVAVGTPAYMSPEQARDSRSVTGASDVFSLGSLLVFAATGHAPYHGVNPVETVFMLLREAPDLSGLPPELAPLVKACMRPAAERRPTPAQIQEELAPHLYASGAGEDDDSRDWLPPLAMELIDRRRGRRGGAPLVPPPVQAPPERSEQAPPAPPVPRPAPAADAGPGTLDPRTGELSPVGKAAQPGERPAGGRRHAGAPLPEPAGPTSPTPMVQLVGGAVPIGPGVRATGTGVATHAAEPVPPPGTDWVRRSQSPQPSQAPSQPSQAAAPYPPQSSQSSQSSQPSQAAPAAARWRPWRFRMSNDVWGTPEVHDGTLYITSFEVHALDIGTGRRRFKSRDVAWAVSVADGRIHAADGPNLFTLTAADGSERWRVVLDGWTYSLDTGGGAVVAGTRGGGVQVRSAIDGSEMWQVKDAQQEYENQQSGPCVIGDSVYYQGGGRLWSLDLTTGRPRWSFPLGDDVPSHPVLRQGVLYLASGTRLLALDEASGEQRWRFDTPVALFTPPTPDDQGGLFVADYLGSVTALEAATGAVRWRARTGGRQGADPVLVADGSVLVSSADTVYAFDAAQGDERWRYTARGELTGAPAAAGGLVHLGSRDHSLHTLDLATGRLRWKLDTGGEITGPPVAVDGRVFACSKDRCVYALDAARGTATSRD